MDVFSKLKTTITSTLPLNPFTSDYEIGKQVGTAGPCGCWRIFEGVKKSTRQEAAVWIFEKKQIEKLPKRDREFIIDFLKKGVLQLCKLRHPRIVSVSQTLEDVRDALCFSTEPLLGSLANLMLGKRDGERDSADKPESGNSGSTDPNSATSNLPFLDLEAKYGVLQILEALAFLHNDVKLIHHNVAPESVVVNRAGAWKLAGFEFCLPASGGTNASSGGIETVQYDFPIDAHSFTQPNLNFVAPERLVQGAASVLSDMFSVGVLIYVLLTGRYLLGEPTTSIQTHRSRLDKVKHMTIHMLMHIPEEMRSYIKLLLSYESTLRPDANQLGKIGWFAEVSVQTLQCLDNVYQFDNLQRSQFYKNLPQVSSKLPKRINLYRVLPVLTQEFANANMVPFVLPTVFIIIEQLTEAEYAANVFPSLTQVLKIDNPPHVPVMMLRNMPILLRKTAANDVRNYIVPMLTRALDIESVHVQELCLSVLPDIASLMDYALLKNSIIPRIKKLALTTNLLSVRVQCLICLGKLLEYVDKWFVLDEIIPFLTEIPSKEPAVLMTVLGICQVAFQHKKLGISKEVLAGRVLPFLLPISIDQSLNLHQFNLFMTLIREMLTRLETEHRGKLEQLASLQAEQRTIPGAAGASASGSSTQGSPSRAGGQGQSASNGGLLNGLMDSLLGDFGLLGYGANGAAPNAAKAATDGKPDTGDFQPFFNVPPSSSNNSSPSKITAANLSIEDKLRLANQKEELERIQKESQNAPPKMTLSTMGRDNTPKPKDLSSTLPPSQPIGSLAASNGNSNQTAAQRAVNASLTANMSGLNIASQTTMRPSTASDNAAFPTMTPNWSSNTFAGINQMASTSMNTFGGNQPAAMTLSNTSAGAQQQRPNVNLSAFDSLVAMPTQAKAPILAQSTAVPRIAAPANIGMNVMQPQVQTGGFAGNFTGVRQAAPVTTGASAPQGMMGAPSGLAMPLMRPPLAASASTQNSQALSKKDIDDLLG